MRVFYPVSRCFSIDCLMYHISSSQIDFEYYSEWMSASWSFDRNREVSSSLSNKLYDSSIFWVRRNQ